MVLINNLTIDEINAALIHLYRSRTEVVGGEKGETVNNVYINNTTNMSGGGQSTDYSQVIASLRERLDSAERDIINLETTDTSIESQIAQILEQLEQMSEEGIYDLGFDEGSRQLTIYMQNGDEYTCDITSETVSLTFDSTTNKLTFVMGEQTQEVTLPYINANEKGVAGGVATLDSSGRVPYSQLPESAMEFLGEWDASTNTPQLEDGTGTNGDFYVCVVGGTVNFGTVAEPRNITFYPNDRVVYEGTSQRWFRLPAGEVRSVNGLSGDVVLDANNINYDNNTTLKQKIDSIVQVQSDWTETDSTKKSFIKNKIPIWITSGSASDNMQPIDSVTDGEMRPVTSNAVHGYIPPYAKNTSALDKAIDCNTAAGTAAKVVDLAGFTLVKGARLIVNLKNANTAQSALTLNVNSTGAKTIRWNGSVTSSSTYAMTATQYNCYYDGTYWNMDSGYEARSARVSNSADIATKGRARPTFTCSTGASTVAKAVSVSGYSIATRDEVLIYFSNTNTASNPTLNVNSTGAKPIKVFGTSPNSTNGLLKSGTYYCQYDGTNWNCYPYGVTNEVSANNMQSVSSGAVYDELMNLYHQKSGILIPTPSYSRFSFIISPNFVLQRTGASGKTLKFVFLNYVYDTGFSGQISWGTTDAQIQQMSGAGRVGYQTINFNSHSIGQDETWKTFSFSLAIPIGCDIVGISCSSCIGVYDLHFE